MDEQDVRRWVNERKVNRNESPLKIKTDKDRHALNRWNERVGPKVMKKELDQWVQVYYELGEFNFVTDVFGYISEEIVFAYKIEKGRIIITTFYGRVSQKPILKDIVALREFNLKYNQFVDLKLDKDVLQKQKMPSVADEVFLHVKKNRTLYIEKYVTDSGKEMLFYWEHNKGFKEVELGHPELGDHDALILSFLKNSGYAAYVSQYNKHRLPDKSSVSHLA